MEESLYKPRRMPSSGPLKSMVEFAKNREVKNLLTLTLGALSASVGLESFLIPNSFIDGGITGISLIVNEFSKIPLAFLITIFNLPFLFMAFRAVGRRFALRSILGILLLSTFVYTLHYPVATNDPLLAAVFGGFFLGLGIGLAIRGGAIIDGTEVLAIFLSRKTGLSVGNIIMIFNLVLFTVAAYLLSAEVALYAILTYFAASRTVDFVIDGIEGYVGVTIISERSELVRSCIVNVMGRGCTIYKGLKGYAQPGEPLQDTNIVYTVITRLEVAKIMAEIDKVDENAFVIMSSIKDAQGGMIKKKPIHNME